MEIDEQARKDAEHKAAALHALGWQNGVGAAIWARAVADELKRHESARDAYRAQPDREGFERLHSTALLLIVSIDQVLLFERRVRQLTGDARLSAARKGFDRSVPHAEAVRDLIAHLDAYAVNEGWRQTGRQSPPLDKKYLSPLLYWGENDGIYFDLGDEQISLRDAASATIVLAAEVEVVRADQLERASNEANEILARLRSR